jgi:hypothetical protein
MAKVGYFEGSLEKADDPELFRTLHSECIDNAALLHDKILGAYIAGKRSWLGALMLGERCLRKQGTSIASAGLVTYHRNGGYPHIQLEPYSYQTVSEEESHEAWQASVPLDNHSFPETLNINHVVVNQEGVIRAGSRYFTVYGANATVNDSRNYANTGRNMVNLDSLTHLNVILTEGLSRLAIIGE